MATQRKHCLVLSVTFDKPMSAMQAARAASDCIHGQFYPTGDDGLAEEFKIRSIKRAINKTLLKASKRA